MARYTSGRLTCLPLCEISHAARQAPAMTRLNASGILKCRSATMPAVMTSATGSKGACQGVVENSIRAGSGAAAATAGSLTGDVDIKGTGWGRRHPHQSDWASLRVAHKFNACNKTESAFFQDHARHQVRHCRHTVRGL